MREDITNVSGQEQLGVEFVARPRAPLSEAVASALGELSLESRTTLDTRLGRTAVQIGQIILPYGLRRETADYSDYRYRFFKTLAQHQSEAEGQPHAALTPRDIWGEMGESGKLDKDVMNAVKKWLPTLSYYRRPLVVSTGKRGRGSRYAINPAFYLDVIDSHRELSPDLPQPEEVYEAVRHLAQFDFVMREYGVLTLDPELEMSLEALRPDYRRITSRGDSVEEFRAGALSKLDQLLSDQDYISRYKQAIGKTDPEYGLLRYIYDLTPNERYMARRLVKAKVEPVRTWGELRLEAIDENGMLLAYLTPDKKSKKEQAAAGQATQPEAAAEPASEPKAEGLVYDRSDGSLKESEVDLRSERIEALLDVVEAVANDVAATFLTTLNASKSYRLAQIQAVFPRLTTNKLMSAKENGVINPVREKPISLEDVIRIMIHSDPYLRNIFTTRKYKDVIESILSRVISENTERVEKELAGEED